MFSFTARSQTRPPGGQVYDRLAGDGHTVLAPPNPLRGIPYDASFTASIIDQIEGPVVLVGHSYGGAVITVAGSSDKVAGLVYVAGIEVTESYGEVGHIPDAMVTSLTSTFEGKDAPNPHDVAEA
ncbi:MAG TPA: alpha/beta hydrolase, partial [Streptosporangiaceae bacterium]|nr:alpha/beta hydrolase [Streptosporangiaceae bacterium]